MDARPLVALANRISNESACAQRRDIRLLQERAANLVNTRRVPADLQEPLMSGVNALAADTPPCIPAVPVQPTPAPQPQQKPPKPPHHHGHDKHKDHHD